MPMCVCVCVCVCVYHSACQLQPKPEMTVMAGECELLQNFSPIDKVVKLLQ